MTDANKIDTYDANECEIKFLDESHLNEILKLQDIVVKNLSDITSYYVEPTEFFIKQLAIKNSVIGIFIKGELVGFNVASFPGPEDENLGRDIELPEEELSLVAQFGPAAVNPEFRSRGLLNRIVAMHLRVLQENGYRHVCFTVSPNNYPNIKVTMSQGFVFKKIKIKYNNLLRCIFHLDFQERFKQPKYSARISNTDIESQKFTMGLGFYGYDVIKKEDGFDIVFGYDQ